MWRDTQLSTRMVFSFLHTDVVLSDLLSCSSSKLVTASVDGLAVNMDDLINKLGESLTDTFFGL